MTEQHDEPQTDAVTGEVAVYTPAAASTPARLVDMRNPSTDSWTDIVEDVAYLAQRIVGTPMVPEALGSVPKIAAAMLRGRELGLPPMEALTSIHVIKGKAGLYAETMRGLILRAGHEYDIEENTSTRCVMLCRRKGSDRWARFEYTMAEADRAGDTRSNQNYRTRPAEMLLARCTTRMARAMFPDVIHGMRSTEEIEDMSGEDVDPQTAIPAAPVARQQPVSRRPSRPEPRQIEQAPAAERDDQAERNDQAERPAQHGTTQQRRPSRPAPRGATEESPEPDPVPAQGDEGEDGGGDEPQLAPPPDPARERAKKLNVGQRGQIMGHFGRLGIDDREERLEWCRILAGRTEALGSTNELLATEATVVLGKLERIRNRDALDALIEGGAES